MRSFLFLLLILFSTEAPASNKMDQDVRVTHMVPANSLSNAPAQIHFRHQKFDYVVIDSDGGLVLSTLYAMVMLPLCEKMEGLKSKLAGKKWKSISEKEVAGAEDLKPLLRQQCELYLSKHYDTMTSSKELMRIDAELKKDGTKLTYKYMYTQFGGWLRCFHKSLYGLDTLCFFNNELQRRSYFKIGPFSKGNVSINPVGSALSAFWNIKRFEESISSKQERIVCDNPEAMLQAFLKASDELNKIRRFVAVRRMHFDEVNKRYVEVIEKIPVAENIEIWPRKGGKKKSFSTGQIAKRK